MNNGMRTCRMMPSALMKAVQPSLIDAEMKPQKIRPTQMKGRNSCIGDRKRVPKTSPSAPIKYAHVDGQPKGSDPRAPVTLGHILPAERRGQVMLLQRGAYVG